MRNKTSKHKGLLIRAAQAQFSSTTGQSIQSRPLVSVNRNHPVKGDIHDQPIDSTCLGVLNVPDRNQIQSAAHALLIPALLVVYTISLSRSAGLGNTK